MALATYADLCASIASWLMRKDLTSVIPDMVTLAEVRLNRELRIREMLQVITPTPSVTTDALDLPADFLETKAITFAGALLPIEYVTPELMQRARLAKPTNGIPVRYTVQGIQWLFDRAPGSATDVSVLYYAKIPPLATTLNAIFQSYPDLYLWAALSQATTFLDRDERLTTWEAKYGNALDMANAADAAGELTAERLRVQPTRVF